MSLSDRSVVLFGNAGRLVLCGCALRLAHSRSKIIGSTLLLAPHPKVAQINTMLQLRLSKAKVELFKWQR
jgi:hypothetical protein